MGVEEEILAEARELIRRRPYPGAAGMKTLRCLLGEDKDLVFFRLGSGYRRDWKAVATRMQKPEGWCRSRYRKLLTRMRTKA